MKNDGVSEPRADAALGHALARLALGLNIAMHGYTRLPNVNGFASALAKQFAKTFLPAQLVYVTAYGIAIGEALIGTCLFFGLLLKTRSGARDIVDAPVTFWQYAYSAVGDRFHPTDLRCILCRIARYTFL
jgi:uncharacterized membrane protein YphA (DoxX/SURF4 family)